MDKILLNGCRFYAYHGALAEEQVLGQIFMIDMELYLDLKKAGHSDKVDDTVHYGLVYEAVKAEVEESKHALIEHLAETICQKLFKAFPLIDAMKIRIIKENPPIAGHYQSVGVEIERKR
ncbi:dihydroneopterin aldolase [Streptococcus iniae]|uniref:7,8-dihydroneopterin aldolase n=2 Tax=Streptococcus iniae TaxID=1346 RepID=A0A3L8GGF6_STRIN|nr:dihydroneopterin aldolase [Streptococcus iniae]AGM98901.1 dihydroneopterin aldolase [Streptococcus iniae SF1]AHY15858.1 dihydroneopterin aldolase [Streptococcus iniae]AHY17726.1 dihydroneopterin aldolase [Streptococcus iniae]AJG26018.1 dihydroneopterin aldolase [Streptococcus iniae]APD31895.1 dihydroneopterin aldolase [Streptococcus iniae]